MIVALIVGLLIGYDAEALPEAPTKAAFELQSESDAGAAEIAVDFTSLRSRPIFHQTRRQFVAVVSRAPVAQEVPQYPIENYELKGIVFKRSGNSIAYISNKVNEQQHKLMTGETFDKWKVLSVQRTSIEVSNGSRSVDLKLRSGDK